MVKIRWCRRWALGLAASVLTLSGCQGLILWEPGSRIALGPRTGPSTSSHVHVRSFSRRRVHDGQRGVRTSPRDTALGVASHHHKNWFAEALEQAFSNEHFASPPEGVRASARHILLDSPDLCHEAVHRIESGQLTFEEAAHRYSTCPSKYDGGSLGSFHRGTMVPEFDELVFDPQTPLRTVVGPVHTSFGYHIVVVDKRSGV